jgi:cell division protein FtsB
METRERWSDSPSWPADDASGHNEAPEHPGGSVSATSDAERDTPGRWQESMTRAAAAADDQKSRDDSRGGKPDASPEPVTGARAVPDREKPPAGRRLSSAGALIWLLLALLGFTLAVQLRSNDQDAGLATARQEDLVGILSDLEARDQRLQQEINALEESQRQLTSGVAGRQAALAEAEKRADELGLLSGTLPARGPGLKISIDPRGAPMRKRRSVSDTNPPSAHRPAPSQIHGASGFQ